MTPKKKKKKNKGLITQYKRTRKNKNSSDELTQRSLGMRKENYLALFPLTSAFTILSPIPSANGNM